MSMEISPNKYESDEEPFFSLDEEDESPVVPETPLREATPPLQGRVSRSLPEIFEEEEKELKLSQSLPATFNPILAMKGIPTDKLGSSPPERRERARSLKRQRPD
ncbi:MAG: hypothetical protein ChlgKO_07220 [Chlamydiales bacterium]